MPSSTDRHPPRRRPTAVVLTVGDELLSGDTVNTNLAVIGAQARERGLEVVRAVSVRDRFDELEAALHEAAAVAAVCLMSGGLGPTEDDLTAEAVARACGVPLVRDPEVIADITAKFAAVGRPMTAINAKQADLPSGARRLDNPVGTAPGFAVQLGECLICAMPGVPREMTRMLEAQVWPAVAQHVELRPIARRVHRAIGLGESALATAVTPILTAARARSPGLAAMVVHYRANQPQVLLILEGVADEQGRAATVEELASLDAAIAAAIGPAYVGEGEDDLPTRLVASLAAEGVRLGAAESCTGGQISALITAVPGASAVFDGAVVSYDNRVKEALLGVPAAVLAEHGAVSEAVARAMAEGAQRALGCPVTIATTGIAGPDGGTPDKPVGTVHVALHDARDPAGHTRHVQLALRGNRTTIQRAAALWALKLVWDRQRERRALGLA